VAKYKVTDKLTHNHQTPALGSELDESFFDYEPDPRFKPGIKANAAAELVAAGCLVRVPDAPAQPVKK
jgi:hypothetical protein